MPMAASGLGWEPRVGTPPMIAGIPPPILSSMSRGGEGGGQWVVGPGYGHVNKYKNYPMGYLL